MSIEPLVLAENLTIPPEAITQTFGVLGKRGSGKTYTASVLVEEMLTAGGQVVVIDPLDAWWGLRSSGDGEAVGLPIVVIGGAHGDLPLDEKAGTAIADLVVEEQIPAVLSLRHLSKGAQRRFVTDFAERLYHRKGEDRYRQPVHIVIDEADAFVPQRVMADTARVMGAIDDLVRRGRSSGIGVTLISQRASVVHKDVLTQIEVLVALRTVSPQDRKAIESWIEAHDPEDKGRTVLSSLASLPIGTAWFWSPGWLEILRKVQVRQRRTFDSSSTPAIGETKLEPRRLADVDLDRITARLQASIEQAAQEDPRLLRKRIAELERQLEERPAGEMVIEYRDSPETLAAIEEMREFRHQIAAAHLDIWNEVVRYIPVLDQLRALLLSIESFDRPAILRAIGREEGETVEEAPPKPALRPAPPPDRVSQVVVQKAESTGLRRGERRILEELARMEPRRLTKHQVATLVGIKVGGSTFSTYLGVLRRGGYLVDDRDQLSLTDRGRAVIEDSTPPAPQTTQDLVALWSAKLRAGERAMLDRVVDAYPASVTRDELAAAVGIGVAGSTFSTYIGVLRRNGLVEVDGQDIRASESFFLAQEARR